MTIEPGDFHMLNSLVDMLCIKFLKRSQVLYIPYCEVANGGITGCGEVDGNFTVSIDNLEDPSAATLELSGGDFIKEIESSLGRGKIAKLYLKLPSGDNYTEVTK